MKVKHRLYIALTIAIILSVSGIRLLFVAEAFKYGLILLGVVAVAVLFWLAFVRGSQKELVESEKDKEELEKQVADLNRTVEELSHSPLNVASLTPVLHLSVINIDTSFTRSYIRTDEERGLTFQGALRADIQAEYGIRLEDVRFRYDEATDTLMLANFNPGLLSFSKKQLHWDLANTMHDRSVLGIRLSPAGDKEAQDFTKEMKEQIRAEVEKEIDQRKISEFEWLTPIVSRQVTEVIRKAIGRPHATVAIIEDYPDSPGYLPLDEFKNCLHLQK